MDKPHIAHIYTIHVTNIHHAHLTYSPQFHHTHQCTQHTAHKSHLTTHTKDISHTETADTHHTTIPCRPYTPMPTYQKNTDTVKGNRHTKNIQHMVTRHTHHKHTIYIHNTYTQTPQHPFKVFFIFFPFWFIYSLSCYLDTCYVIATEVSPVLRWVRFVLVGGAYKCSG